MITLVFEAISLRKERLLTIHEQFIISFSLPYSFDVPYQYDSQNRIDFTKSIMLWLRKHLTAEDISNNENVDFNLYQFALVTKDAEFFQWFWKLAGTEIQQKLLKFSIGEVNPFFAAVEMGVLWFCELLYSQSNTEQQSTLLTQNLFMAFRLAAANSRFDICDWLYGVHNNTRMLIHSEALAAAAASGNRAMIEMLWNLATTNEIKRLTLGENHFAAFREAINSGNLETCELILKMAKEINAENDMLMAVYGGSCLNIAASKGHLHVCQWVASIANAQQLPLLLMNMNVDHFPSKRSLTTVALYRWVWNIASPEMRQVILTVNDYEVFKRALEIGLIPICRLLLGNASDEQHDQMLIAGLNFTKCDDKFSIKAFDWAWENANAKIRELILDKLLVKDVDYVFTVTVLLSRNQKYGQWLWEKATRDQQHVILRVLNEALANPQYHFGNATHIWNWVSALEKSLQKQEQPEGATQASSAFFHNPNIPDVQDIEKKPTDDETPGNR